MTILNLYGSVISVCSLRGKGVDMQIPISPENYQIFNSLASPTRLQILNLLAEGPSNIHSLAQAVGITPTMAVKHIRQLEAAGLVVSETLPGKRGMQKLCRLNHYTEKTVRKIVEIPGNQLRFHMITPCSVGFS